MGTADVSELGSKYQSLASTTRELAKEITELRRRNQNLLTFQAFQPQENRLLTITLSGAIVSVETHHRQSWLRGVTNISFTGRSVIAHIIGSKVSVRGPLISVIELFQTAESRAEEYKVKVTEQSEDCTCTYARATSNKSTSNSLPGDIVDCRDATSVEIESTTN